MKLRPISIKGASRLVGRLHRHCKPPVGGLFAVAVEVDGVVVGVAVVGRPSGRGLQDGYTCEITRVATDGAPSACSMLYGAAARAAKALGYRRVVTYTLDREPGTSLRAAGFLVDTSLKARATWDGPSRTRIQVNLFGDQERPPGPKVRWVRWLASPGEVE